MDMRNARKAARQRRAGQEKINLKSSVQESGAGGARGWKMVKSETGRQVVSQKIFLAGIRLGNEKAGI